jgi:hypothetical protein
MPCAAAWCCDLTPRCDRAMPQTAAEPYSQDVIGIVLSVIWFFGFGLFLWHELVESEVAPYVVALKACSQIEYSGDTDDPDVRMKRFDRAEKCRSDAKQRSLSRSSHSSLSQILF